MFDLDKAIFFRLRREPGLSCQKNNINRKSINTTGGQPLKILGRNSIYFRYYEPAKMPQPKLISKARMAHTGTRSSKFHEESEDITVRTWYYKIFWSCRIRYQ